MTQKTMMQKILDKRERVFVGELFKAVEASKKQEKIELLRAYMEKGPTEAKTLRGVLECLFHPAVQFDLPEGDPPFKTDYPDYTLAPSSLFKEISKVKYWAECGGKIKDNVKRERVFIQSLESMFKPEADILLAMKDKKPVRVCKGLTERFVREVFPDILPPSENLGNE